MKKTTPKNKPPTTSYNPLKKPKQLSFKVLFFGVGGGLCCLNHFTVICIDCKLDPKTQNDIVDMKNGTSTRETQNDTNNTNETSMQSDANNNDNDKQNDAIDK